MMAAILSRALIMSFGYVYPAYECYKVVELNKPEIEQLRFWCQYWILVALLTVFERVGDTIISWLPMYSEAKLAFYIYLWHSRTKGTTFVYENLFRPYIQKYQTEIDRTLLVMKTRAGDVIVYVWQNAASYGQTRLFEFLQYVASQSSAPRKQIDQQLQQLRQQPQAHQARIALAAAGQQAELELSQHESRVHVKEKSVGYSQGTTTLHRPLPCEESTKAGIVISPASECTDRLLQGMAREEEATIMTHRRFRK